MEHRYRLVSLDLSDAGQGAAFRVEKISCWRAEEVEGAETNCYDALWLDHRNNLPDAWKAERFNFFASATRYRLSIALNVWRPDKNRIQPDAFNKT